MGYAKETRPLLAVGGVGVRTSGLTISPSGGVGDAAQSLSSTQSGDTLSGYGASFITAGATAGDNVFLLGAPAEAGIRKTIVVDVNTTDAVDVVAESTLGVFWGTTTNALRFSTGAVTPKRAELIARSTAAAGGWAVQSLSTGVTLIATTVSTG